MGTEPYATSIWVELGVLQPGGLAIYWRKSVEMGAESDQIVAILGDFPSATESDVIGLQMRL
jgi:hypothetical protein